MKSQKNLLAGMTLLAAFTMAPPAGAYVIDGDLQDWLAGAPTRSADDWLPKAGVKWAAEDQITSYLNPGYGGQNYDAEAIYVDISGDDLYIAIVTGRAPGTDVRYPGGDIAINLGWPGGNDDSFEVAIVTQDHDGYTAGDVVAVDEWFYGLWTGANAYDPANANDYKQAHPVAVKSGTRKGEAELVYKKGSYGGATLKDRIGPYTGEHYVIEAKVDLGLLGLDVNGDPFLAHWTQWCANDWIQVDPDPQQIPAPPTLALVGLGLALLGVGRRRPR